MKNYTFLTEQHRARLSLAFCGSTTRKNALPGCCRFVFIRTDMSYFFSLHPPNSVCFLYVLSLFNFMQSSEFNSTRIPLIDKRKRDKSIVFLLASDDQQKAICTAEARKSRNTYPSSEHRIIGCFDMREEYHFDEEMMVKPNRSFSWCIIN